MSANSSCSFLSPKFSIKPWPFQLWLFSGMKLHGTEGLLYNTMVFHIHVNTFSRAVTDFCNGCYDKHVSVLFFEVRIHHSQIFIRAVGSTYLFICKTK
jgi:hypothetical protein